MTWFDRPKKPPAAKPLTFAQTRAASLVDGVHWHKVAKPAPTHLDPLPVVIDPDDPVPPSEPTRDEPEALVSRSPSVRAVSPSRIAPGIDEADRARFDDALARLEQAIVDLVDLKDRLLSHEQQRMTELSIAIARRVVARELRTDPTLVAGLAVEGVVALGERDGVTVRVAPMPDAQLDEAFAAALRSKLPKCEIVRDEAMEAGDCVVETSLGRVDESLSTRLAAAEAALSGDSETEG